MTRTGMRKALLLAAGCLLLAGCGPAKATGSAVGNAPAAGATSTGKAAVQPGAAAGGSTAGIPACGLVSQSDASTAIGTAAGPGKGGGTGDGSECVYHDGVLIISMSNQGKAMYDKYHLAMSAAPSGTFTDVSGIGDGAFEINGGKSATVAFYKGTEVVEVVIVSPTGIPQKDAVIALARIAASHV